MPNVDLSRVPSFYHKYINKVEAGELKEAFETYPAALLEELEKLPSDRWNFRYAEGKWSIKEVVQHIIDAERIFCYRALCFSRKDPTLLPGFDENLYADTSKAGGRNKDELINELKAVQDASRALFISFDDEQLDQTGVANEKSIYVKGIGFIVIGHALHHLSILRERYLAL